MLALSRSDFYFGSVCMMYCLMATFTSVVSVKYIQDSHSNYIEKFGWVFGTALSNWSDVCKLEKQTSNGWWPKRRHRVQNWLVEYSDNDGEFVDHCSARATKLVIDGWSLSFSRSNWDFSGSSAKRKAVWMYCHTLLSCSPINATQTSFCYICLQILYHMNTTYPIALAQSDHWI